MSQSLERGIEILTLIGPTSRSISELSLSSGVHPTTALRLVQSLRKSHLVTLLDDGRYSLGPALIGLGQLAFESNDLRVLARPFLDRLSELTTETVHLAALFGTDIMYIDKVEAKHAIRIESRVGRTALKYCTGVGKAILSGLDPEARKQHYSTIDFVRFTPTTIISLEALDRELALTRLRGYSIDDEEHEPQICCVAVPVKSGAGQVLAAMSVSAPVSRLPLRELEAFLPYIREAASAVSALLGYREPGR